MKLKLAVASLGLAVAAAVFLLVWPVYSGSDGTHEFRRTLLQVNGSSILIPVLFPVVIALMAVLVRSRLVRLFAAAVMGAFSLVAGMSIGMFFLPAAILMLLAAML